MKPSPSSRVAARVGMGGAVARRIVGRHLDQLGQEAGFGVALLLEETVNGRRGDRPSGVPVVRAAAGCGGAREWAWISAGEVEPGICAVLDHPAARDHDPVGAGGAAQDQRGQRVAGAGEAQLVEAEQGEVGLHAGGDRADVGAAEAGGGAARGPAQRVVMGDLLRAVHQALQQEGVAHGLDQVRGCRCWPSRRRRARPARPPPQAAGHRAAARGQDHVRGRAVADGDPGAAERGRSRPRRTRCRAPARPGRRASRPARDSRPAGSRSARGRSLLVLRSRARWVCRRTP